MRDFPYNYSNLPCLEDLGNSPVHVALGEEPGHSVPEGIAAEVPTVGLMSHRPLLRVLPVLDGKDRLVCLQLIAELR